MCPNKGRAYDNRFVSPNNMAWSSTCPFRAVTEASAINDLVDGSQVDRNTGKVAFSFSSRTPWMQYGRRSAAATPIGAVELPSAA